MTTPKVCCHTNCRKLKFKFATSCASGRRLVHQSWCPSVSHLKAWPVCLTDLIFVDPGGEDQRRLLPRHTPIVAAVACDARFLHFSTLRQRTCTPGRQHGGNFLSSQQQCTFIPPDLWPPITSTLIPSITRYSVTSSNKCISRSCTALTN